MEKPIDRASAKTFPKKERLTSKKQIEELFKKGSSVYLYPFRLQYLPATTTEMNNVPPPVLFSVSKRNFKKAIDRNTIRRRMREAYRISRSELFTGISPSHIPTCFALVYTAKEIVSLEMMKKKLILVWQRMLIQEEPQPKSKLE